MRNVFFLTLLAVFVLSLAVASVFAAEAPKAPIELKYFPKHVVRFPHAPHEAHKVECKTCHHKWDGQGEVKACGSAGCHDVFSKKDKSVKSLYKVIHKKSKDPINCLTCHKQQVAGKKGDKAFKKKMTGCKGSACHP